MPQLADASFGRPAALNHICCTDSIVACDDDQIWRAAFSASQHLASSCRGLAPMRSQNSRVSHYGQIGCKGQVRRAIRAGGDMPNGTTGFFRIGIAELLQLVQAVPDDSLIA